MTKRQFFSGNSLEQAVLRAARQFEIDPDRVAYTLRDKKHGFLKGRRRVVIEVDPAAPELPPDAPSAAPESETRREPQARPPSPRAPSPRTPSPRASSPHASSSHASSSHASSSRPEEPRTARAEPEPEQRMPLSERASVERGVREILRFLKLEAEVAVERRPDVFEVEISRTDRTALVDREGRVLQAMEYLVPRLVRSWTGQGVPVKIDSEGFRASRENELRELAARVAEEVRDTGLAQSLEPMHPADRRWVHLSLAESPDVRTESEGEGYYKRVRILPAVPETEPEELDLDELPGDEDGVSRETWAAPYPR